jgi:hypothetical protein
VCQEHSSASGKGIQLSFDISPLTVKSLRPLPDGNFVKELLVCCATKALFQHKMCEEV